MCARRVKTGGGKAITLPARVDGGLQSVPAADKKDTSHSCHLKSHTRLKHGGEKPCVFNRERGQTHADMRTHTHTHTHTHLLLRV